MLKNEVGPHLTPYRNSNSKWISQNIRAKTIKLFEENRVNLWDLGLGNGFLDSTPKAQIEKQKQTKKKDKIDIKILNF